MGKCYSTNDEDYSYDEIEDAIRDKIADHPELTPGDIFTIWEGDAILWKAGDFAGGFCVDDLSDRAYAEAEESADGWLDSCPKEVKDDLETRIEVVVNQWADDHGLQPKFYRVENVCEVKVKVMSEDGEWEIVSPGPLAAPPAAPTIAAAAPRIAPLRAAVSPFTPYGLLPLARTPTG